MQTGISKSHHALVMWIFVLSLALIPTNPILQAQATETAEEQVLRLSPAKHYRYFHQQLERYFDTGDEALFDTLMLQAEAVHEVYGNGFFVKIAGHYWQMRKKDLAQRGELKSRVSASSGQTRKSQTEAVRGYLSAAGEFLAMGDSLSAVVMLQHAAYLQSVLGEKERAGTTLTRTISISRSYGDQDALARSFSLLGGINLKAGDYLEAGESFDSARVIRTILFDTAGVAGCLKNIAAVYKAVGQRRVAFEFTEEAFRRFNSVGDTVEALDAALNLVSSFSELQSTDQLRTWIELAERLMPENPAPVTNARYLYGRAVLQERQINYEQARALCDEATSLNHGDLALKTALLNLAGSCSVKLSQFEVARTFYEQALKTAEQSKLDYGVAVTLINLGSLSQRLGSIEVARDYYESAGAIIHAQPGLLPGVTLSLNLFELYFSTGDTVSALLHLSQAESIAEVTLEGEHNYELLSARVRYLAATGRIDSALTLIDLTRAETEPGCQTDFNLACLEAEVCRLEGRLDHAYDAIINAEAILAECNSRGNQRKLTLIKAHWHFDRGKWAMAAAQFSQLIANIEESQASLEELDLKISYLSKSRYLYEKMALAQYHQFRTAGNPQFLDSLLRYSELCKARGLRELLAEQSPAREADAALTPTIEQLKSRLPDKIGLLYLLLTPDGSIRIFITRNEVSATLLPSRSVLTDLVAEYARLIQDSRSDEATLDSLPRAGEKLGRIVFDGIAGHLDTLNSLFICADGALALLPCATFRIGNQYLIQKVAITNIPALSTKIDFNSNFDAFRQSLRIVAVGISEAGGELARLKSAPQEVNWIAEVRSNDTVMTLIDSEATLNAVRSSDLKSADIIHLATHSTIDYSSPDKSRIWLVSADGAGAKGVTPAELIDSGKLTAKLVVLSACESGGGSFELSEGLIGFVQEFIGRGARQVVVTHWEVEDFTSSVLMRAFYSNLHLGPAEALQQAQIELIDSPRLRHRHPYFWAPFILIEAP